jgi:predicted glycogen debranching enzyme
MHHNGRYRHAPEWYRRFQYFVEQERGLDFEEDLLSPGEFSFELSPGATAWLVYSTSPLEEPVEALRDGELKRRAALADGEDDLATLERAADQFVVERATHRTLLAGYPWFTDWGRDTFISLPGIALATKRQELARELLLAFSGYIEDGLTSNRFCDDGEAPDYNTVDAPLWFVLAVCRFAAREVDKAWSFKQLFPRVQQIIDAYLSGTRHGIGVDDDGLIHAAAPGLQLTWMDAKVGDWVVTPRQGKPVEIQALWVAALEAVARWIGDGQPLYAHELVERAAWARSSFAATFWDESAGYLYDVIDGPRRDLTLRPNQLYAIGLCEPLVDAVRAERILKVCERELLTPFGLRSRARGLGYAPRMTGDQKSRDAAYHEGTVWPYLFGIYADASQRVRGRVPEGLLEGILRHLNGEGLGSIHEIFDGDVPHAPRGCVAQAWSVAEVLRVLVGNVGQDA